jgi:DNA invertase Pin-like site-specific DNA recombinase
MKIGYARVSTDEQNLAMQLDALRAAECEKIREDKASGVLNGRKGLAEALKGCARAGGLETGSAGPVPSRSGGDRGGFERPGASA